MEKEIHKNILIKYLLIIAGTISVALGILGIFLPLLPTTPFLLLAAACYVRSSEKLYHRLISNKIFGNYIKNYMKSKILPIRVKVVALIVLWVTILTTVYLFSDKVLITIGLLLIAGAVTFHILKLRSGL